MWKNKRIDLHGHIFVEDFSNVKRGNRFYGHFILRENVRLVAANNSASEGLDSLDILYQVILVHPLDGQGRADRYYNDNVLRHIRHDDADQNYDRVNSIVAYLYNRRRTRRPKIQPSTRWFS